MSNIVSKVIGLLFDKDYRFLIASGHGFYKRMSDEEFIKRKFSIIMKKELNLNNPITFNEKLQWLKLHDRKLEYSMMVDKVAVKNYIAEKLGEEYLIPTLGVWEKATDIDFDTLPDKFVIKCNHNSGLGMAICKNKSNFNVRKAKKMLKRGLKQNYYFTGREWPYKNVIPKVIAEKYIEDQSGGLIDYKFFCFDGYVDCVMVCLDRHLGDTKFYFFDDEWNLKRINVRGKEAPENFSIRKPKCMDRMFEIARKLSQGLPFVRVDLYESDNKIYFGEMTFFPDSGMDPNLLYETDVYFGSLIDFSKVDKKG